MEWMRVLLVEDDLQWLEKIKEHMLNYQFEKNVDFEIEVSHSIQDIFQYHQEIDLILIDIEVGKERSISYYRQIVKEFPKTALCYVTTHIDYMPDAFGMNVVGYVLKKDLSKLDSILSEALKRKEVKGHWFQAVGGRQFISFDSILYISSINKKLQLTTIHQSYDLTMKGIEQLEKELPSQFILVNKQDIINLDKITFVSRDRLDLNHQTMLFVISRRKYAMVIDAYMQRIGEIML